VHGERSARSVTAQVFVVFFASSCVSFVRSILSVDLLHEVRGRSVLECRTVHDGANGPRAHRGRSVIKGAVLDVRGHFSDSPPQLADRPSCPRGRSARRSRTVRQVTCKTAKSFVS
jgi:hypothetical protein